jgi:CMP-N-acetylneuraminic acid synthetase
MKTLGVICARAGSVRLPGKHGYIFGGKTLIERVVDAAMAASLLNRVMVSTDSEEIFEKVDRGPHSDRIALRRRPASLATDKSAIEDVLLDALYWAEENFKEKFDAVAFLPGNAVMVHHSLINQCIAKLERVSSATAVMTVRQVSEPPEWMWRCAKVDSDGYCLMREPIGEDSGGAYRMQDVMKRYIATGTVNVVRAQVLRSFRGGAYRWMGDTIMGVLDPDAIEIHDFDDVVYAQAKLGDFSEGEE